MVFHISTNRKDTRAEHEKKVRAAAAAVGNQHHHSIPLDMKDIREDLDTPLIDASLAAKTSVIVRAGALDLSGGTGSFRVRELMGRMAMSMGCYVRADVKLTDIEAECSDGENRMAEVVDLPTTGVNTERIWYMEHFADWLAVNLGQKSKYHNAGDFSASMVDGLPQGKKHRISLPTHMTQSPISKEACERAHNSLDDNGVPPHHADRVTTKLLPTHAPEDAPATPATPATPTAQTAANAAGNASTTPAVDSVDLGSYGHDIREEHRHTGAFHGVTVRQVHERLDAIEFKKPLYSPAFAALAAAVACASFVFLLGGGLYDMLAAFIGAGCGQFLRSNLMRRHINQFFGASCSCGNRIPAVAGILRPHGASPRHRLHRRHSVRHPRIPIDHGRP